MPDETDGHIKTLAMSFQWATPAYIDQMFCDKLDHHGIIYWYDELEEQHRQNEANKPKIK